MTVPTATSADVGCGLFLTTGGVCNATENLFIIHGSTVQAGNICPITGD